MDPITTGSGVRQQIKVCNNTENFSIYVWDNFTKQAWEKNKIYYFENLQYKAAYDQLKTVRQSKIQIENDVTDKWLLYEIASLRSQQNQVNDPTQTSKEFFDMVCRVNSIDQSYFNHQKRFQVAKAWITDMDTGKEMTLSLFN